MISAPISLLRFGGPAELLTAEVGLFDFDLLLFLSTFIIIAGERLFFTAGDFDFVITGLFDFGFSARATAFDAVVFGRATTEAFGMRDIAAVFGLAFFF